MRTYLIAQPCAIMIRGLPRWLDSTLPWVASTRSSPASSQNLTGRSVRAAEHPSSLGKPSTRPLVRPAPNRFGPARRGPEPVIEQCETLPTGARSSSSSSEASWKMPCQAPPACAA